MAAVTSLVHLGSLMGGVRTVDQVGVEERATSLGKRSIKKASKVWALELAIRMMDLTTLEGADTPGKVAALCAKGIRPDPTEPSIPSTARSRSCLPASWSAPLFGGRRVREGGRRSLQPTPVHYLLAARELWRRVAQGRDPRRAAMDRQGPSS